MKTQWQWLSHKNTTLTELPRFPNHIEKLLRSNHEKNNRNIFLH